MEVTLLDRFLFRMRTWFSRRREKTSMEVSQGDTIDDLRKEIASCELQSIELRKKLADLEVTLEIERRISASERAIHKRETELMAKVIERNIQRVQAETAEAVVRQATIPGQ